MKTIQLTRKQESKLLMMFVFFFEDNTMSIEGTKEDNDGPYIDSCRLIQFLKKDKKKSKKLGLQYGYNSSIHWYEFCFEHLIYKLNQSVYCYQRWCREEGKIHIVDYLYDRFKDIKAAQKQNKK